MSSLQYLVFLFEILVLLYGIWHYKKIINNGYGFFLIIAAYTFIQDIAGLLMTKVNWVSNKAYYNITLPILALMYMYFYYSQMFTELTKKITLAIIFSFIFCFIIELVFIHQFQKELFTYNLAIGALCICIIISMHLYHLLQTNKILQLKSEFMVWTSIGLLVYYIIEFPFMMSYNYLISANLLAFSMLFRITYFFSLLEFSLFLIGIRCMPEK